MPGFGSNSPRLQPKAKLVHTCTCTCNYIIFTTNLYCKCVHVYIYNVCTCTCTIVCIVCVHVHVHYTMHVTMYCTIAMASKFRKTLLFFDLNYTFVHVLMYTCMYMYNCIFYIQNMYVYFTCTCSY